MFESYKINSLTVRVSSLESKLTALKAENAKLQQTVKALLANVVVLAESTDKTLKILAQNCHTHER